MIVTRHIFLIVLVTFLFGCGGSGSGNNEGVLAWHHPASLKDNITPDGRNAYYPQISMNSSGDAIITWMQSDGINDQIFISVREGSTGEWVHPIDLSDNISPDGTDADQPQVALNDSGDAIVTWHQSDGDRYQIFISHRDGTTGVWTHPSALTDNISPDSQPAGLPTVALNDAGDAIVAWQQFGGLVLSERDGSTSNWTHPVDSTDIISPSGQAAVHIDLQMNNSGDAIVAWTQSDGTNQQIFLSERDGGTRTWSRPSDLNDNISPAGEDFIFPSVDINESGDVVIVWSTSFIFVNNLGGGFGKLFISEKDGASNVWSHPSVLSDHVNPEIYSTYPPPAKSDSNSPKVAINDNGDAVVTWEQTVSNTLPMQSLVFVSERDGNTGDWIHPSDIADKFNESATSSGDPEVAINDSGKSIVCWDRYYSGDTRVYLSERDGANLTWEHPGSDTDYISLDGAFASSPKVVMNNFGNAIIVWTQSDGNFNQLYISELK